MPKSLLLPALLLCTLLTAHTSVATEFSVTSKSFDDSSFLKHRFSANVFGCDGKNISPQLSWSNAPEGTKSFAITVYDPDAPTGSGFWHWLVVNIPADTTSLKAGATDLPAQALQTRTDFGKPGYGGPCPPQGHHVHRYIFKVHAVDVEKLDVNADTSPAVVGFNLHFRSLATAQFMGLYKR